MTGNELFLGIVIGMTVLLLVVFLITLIVTKSEKESINSIDNMFLGKLANTDSSIQEAMKYLKLTNSIEDAEWMENR